MNKKTYFVFSLFLLSFLVAGCQQNSPLIVYVDLDTLESTYEIENFDLSDIELIIENGDSKQWIALEESMLETPIPTKAGNHQIRGTYEDISFSFELHFTINAQDYDDLLHAIERIESQNYQLNMSFGFTESLDAPFSPSHSFHKTVDGDYRKNILDDGNTLYRDLNQLKAYHQRVVNAFEVDSIDDIKPVYYDILSWDTFNVTDFSLGNDGFVLNPDKAQHVISKPYAYLDHGFVFHSFTINANDDFVELIIVAKNSAPNITQYKQWVYHIDSFNEQRITLPHEVTFNIDNNDSMNIYVEDGITLTHEMLDLLEESVFGLYVDDNYNIPFNMNNQIKETLKLYVVTD